MLEVRQDNVVVSAIKSAKDGTTVLRVYEAAGKPTRRLNVKFHIGIGEVYEANLIEDTGALIAVNTDSLTFDLRPFEIKTFKFKIEALRPLE